MTLLLTQHNPIMSSNLHYYNHSLASDESSSSAAQTASTALGNRAIPSASGSSIGGAASSGGPGTSGSSTSSATAVPPSGNIVPPITQSQQRSCDVFLGSFLMELLGQTSQISQISGPGSAKDIASGGILTAVGQRKLDVYGPVASSSPSAAANLAYQLQQQQTAANQSSSSPTRHIISSVANNSTNFLSPSPQMATPSNVPKPPSSDTSSSYGFLSTRKQISAQEFSFMSPSSF